MSRQSKRQAGAVGFCHGHGAGCCGLHYDGESTAAAGTTVTGSTGQGTVVGGVTAAGEAVVGGVTTVGSAIVSPFMPSSYNNWGYTDANGVYHRYDRYGYYDAKGIYIPYANARGAYCAKWYPLTNTCVWWLTG